MFTSIFGEIGGGGANWQREWKNWVKEEEASWVPVSRCRQSSSVKNVSESFLKGGGVNRQNLNFTHFKNNQSGKTGLTGLPNRFDRYEYIQIDFPQQAV
jgi:hypothetical protein